MSRPPRSPFEYHGDPDSLDEDDDDYEEERPRSRRSKVKKGSNAGLCWGIGSMIAWIIPIVGLPVSITGMVYSGRDLTTRHRGTAIAGLVLSIFGLILTIANGALGAYLAIQNMKH